MSEKPSTTDESATAREQAGKPTNSSGTSVTRPEETPTEKGLHDLAVATDTVAPQKEQTDSSVAEAGAETDRQRSRRPLRKSLPLTIDLLRHGKVATPSLFSAPLEEPLGMEGWKQLTLATQGGNWDVVIAPPIRRCHDFARLLAQRLECEFRVDERFSELDFGQWIGLSQREILARDPELLQQYYFQPRRFHAPDGESMTLFMERVHQGWSDLLTSCAGQRVLILTHSGVIRVLLGKALDLLYQKTLRFEVDYARFSRLSVYPDGEIILSGHGLLRVSDL